MAKSNYQKYMERVRARCGTKLKLVREYFGYSQARMAGEMHVSETTYSKNERGIHLPATLNLIDLSNGLDISLEWLLFDRGSMFWKDNEQKQLAAARLKELEASMEPASYPGDLFTLEVNEMIELMKQVPLLRHSVLGYYQRFRLDHKDLIEESTGKGEAKSESPGDETVEDLVNSLKKS